MNARTKALAIPKGVKEAVFRRDLGVCVICGSPNAGPHCHYIRRSQSGLGIEQNIWTGCQSCHEAFDTEGPDGSLHGIVAAHLRGWYPGWDAKNLRYRKDM